MMSGKPSETHCEPKPELEKNPRTRLLGGTLGCAGWGESWRTVKGEMTKYGHGEHGAGGVAWGGGGMTGVRGNSGKIRGEMHPLALETSGRAHATGTDVIEGFGGCGARRAGGLTIAL